MTDSQKWRVGWKLFETASELTVYIYKLSSIPEWSYGDSI